MTTNTEVHNIVLVHGGFVDGSGWRGVYDALKADGFNVSVVQNQTLSLESDVETTHNVLDQQDGPAILVGHSYGGAVITIAAARATNVIGLVFVAAFAPDAGERLGEAVGDRPDLLAVLELDVDDGDVEAARLDMFERRGDAVAGRDHLVAERIEEVLEHHRDERLVLDEVRVDARRGAGQVEPQAVEARELGPSRLDARRHAGW